MRILFTYFLLFYACFLHAQEYSVSQYSIGEGLSQSQVRAIFQDRKGFIWMGTHRGLCRFDGRKFIDFQSEDGLSGRFVNAIAQDKKGVLWIATESGISQYDGVKFKTLVKEQLNGVNTVLSLLCDTRGNVWLGTKGGGVIRYENGQFVAVKDAVPTDIYTMVEDTLTGKIWIGTNSGLYILENGKIQKAKGFPDIEVFSLLPVAQTGLWAGTNKGVLRYFEENTIFFSQNISDRNIFCLEKGSDNQIWAGTGAGIIQLSYAINPESGAIEVRSAPFVSKNWSDKNVVKAACKDDEGNLWFGTEGEGVFKIRKGLFQTYSEEEGMSSNISKSFLEDNMGRIWISTTNSGINILYPPNIRTDNSKPFEYFTKERGISGNDICYSYEDSKGRFWFATYQHGLTCIHPDGKVEIFDKYRGLLSNQTYCVSEDKTGNIWVGTDAGVSVWDGAVFSRITSENGLISNVVYAIFHDSKGNVWFGTPSGVTCMTVPGGIRNYTVKDGIGDNLVLTILEDKNGNIWITTSSGLSTWNGKKWKKVLLPGSTAANDIVSMVFEKNQDFAWVGTNYGVFRINIGRFHTDSTFTYEHYTTTDGLPSLECNGNAAFRDNEGDIWIGTIGGAVRYHTDSLSSIQEMPPKVHLTNVKLFFSPVLTQPEYYSGVSDETGLPQGLSLPYNQNHLTFEFIGICYAKPSAVRYQIQVEGFDKGWLPVMEENTFTYSNLPPGSYKFRVRATNNLRDWVEGVPFSFSIQSPFWFSWWFILMALMLLLLTGFGIYHYFKEKAERKRETERMQTKSDMLQLEQQALYAMMNPHFTFNALQSIQYFIHSQDKLMATKFLSQFAKLVRMNLDSSKKEFISLSEEIERLKLYLSLEKMRFQDKFDYEIQLEDQIDKSETQIPPMILQPFVENSIKHGIMPLEEKGIITVIISQLDEDTLSVEIMDNGIGIEASKRKKADRPSDHVSQGMQITRDRLKLFSKNTGKPYTVTIQEMHNAEGGVSGTKVDILLPMKARV